MHPAIFLGLTSIMSSLVGFSLGFLVLVACKSTKWPQHWNKYPLPPSIGSIPYWASIDVIKFNISTKNYWLWVCVFEKDCGLQKSHGWPCMSWMLGLHSVVEQEVTVMPEYATLSIAVEPLTTISMSVKRLSTVVCYCILFVIHSCMEERHLAEWGS